MPSPAPSDMDLEDDPAAALEKTLLESEAGNSTDYDEFLKQQEWKIEKLIEENLSLKEKQKELEFLKKKVDEQTKSLGQLLKYNEDLKKRLDSNSTADIQVATEPSDLTQKQVMNHPPQSAPGTSMCGNNEKESPLNQSFSFASFVPPNHTHNSGFQVNTSSSNNLYSQVQNSTGAENPFRNPPSAQTGAYPSFFNTEGINNNSSNNQYQSSMSRNPQLESSKNPFFSNQQNSNRNVSRPFLSSNRPNQTLPTNYPNKNKKFMVPFKAWLKKHNMKENQSFRGKRGGDPKKRQHFAQKYSRNDLTNRTLSDVASYHVALAKSAVEQDVRNKKYDRK